MEEIKEGELPSSLAHPLILPRKKNPAERAGNNEAGESAGYDYGMDATLPRRRWYQFGMWQVLEGTFWVAVSVFAIKSAFAMDDGEDKVTILLLAGAPMGAAVGAVLPNDSLQAAVGAARCCDMDDSDSRWWQTTDRHLAIVTNFRATL